MLTRSKSNSTINRPLTAIPNTNSKNNEAQNLVLYTNRKTLTNLIPDLPQFSKKNGNSTALLYSKFIMKGIKTNKVDLVKQSFNMKKENLIYEKKNSLNIMKTIKSTVNSTKNEFLHHSIANQYQYKSNNKDSNELNEGKKQLNSQINSFIRINSAKKPTKTNQVNQNYQNLLNVCSQKVISRPKSAALTPQTFIRNTRAQTAKHRKSPSLCNPFTIDSQDYGQSQTERKVSSLMKIQKQGRLFVNYIQRNKRLLSASSNKTSVYLTGIDSKKIQNQNEDPKTLLLKHLKKKLSPQKNKYVMIQDLDEDDFQVQRKRNPLTQREMEQITKKNRVNAEFMKEHMPNQYKKYVLYLQLRQNNMTQKDRALLSINLDNNCEQFEQKNKRNKNLQQTFEEAKEYYQVCENLCDQALHHINLYKNRKLMPKVTQEILNIGACQELIKLQKQRFSINQKSQKQAQENLSITQIKQKMYQLVKKLTFFKQKSEEICKKIFDLDFEIFTVEEDKQIIKKTDHAKFIYVILNGSVLKKTKNQQEKENETKKKLIIQGQQFENTLFDGQSFGQPQNKNDELYNYDIISSQRVFLMKFSYFQFCKIYKENSNIQERIELLNKIFGKIPGCKPLKNQIFQELALEMQPLTFQAKQIIFRKGDVCEKLIIIASGRALMTNEHILKRQKKTSNDMKKRSKSLTKINLKDFSIENLRRNNLKNYEILQQNEEQFVYYYQDVTKELIKSDVINWQGFYHQQRQYQRFEDNFLTEQPQRNNQNNCSLPFTLNYSLISKEDNTKVYLIDMKRLFKLPELLKQTIDVKVNLIFSKQNQKSKKQKQQNKFTSIQKWDNFKQKLCSEIVNNKIKF